MLAQAYGNNLAIPKILFRSSRYSSLSASSKLVYALLLECLQYSQSRNWLDANGDVYLLLPQEAIGQSLGFGRNVINRAMKELSEYGLVEIKQQGLCLPNRIYVLAPVIRPEELNIDACQSLLFH